MRKGLALLLLALLPACGRSAAFPVGGGGPGDAAARAADGPRERCAVTVRVTWRDVPLPGVRVEWSASVVPGEGDAPVASVTDGRGTASFSLPPGRRFLTARWRPDGDFARAAAPGDRFAFFGGSPVYLSSGGPPREIFLGLAEHAAPPPAAAGEDDGTGVSGVVTADGAPLSGALVFAYTRTETAFRDMGFAASAPTSDDGSFFLDLPPGNYYLVVRRRAGGGTAGPLRKGDAFGYYPANPVEVASGRSTRVTLPAMVLRQRNVPSWSGESPAAAHIEGRILGRGGDPVEGVHAALYENPDLLDRPVFLSGETGRDGFYRLPVPVPGRYYLGARSGYGGSPASGDFYGRYEGNPEHAVTVRKGDRLTGMDITVEEVR